MTYSTIYTTSGLTSLAAAVASGVPIVLTQMAVGDGNGNPVTPSQSQTALARELFRASVNRVYQDPDNPTLFTAELVIPATTGGFVLREVGVFDSHGNLFAVGNLPDTYKPTSSEGAFSDAVVRVEFVATNASVITLMVDPSVAVATQSWIINNITRATILPGGTTGQLLAKQSNADGDTHWVNPTDVNVVVNMIEEDQTLAAGQTAVILATVTTNGLAVYIEGVRLTAAEWTAVDATHLTLAASYPAGTKFTGVQNEPAGSVVFPLAQNLNLSDVPNKATARTNLGVPSVAESNAAGQPGAVVYFAGSTTPNGWLKANGAAISRTAYAALFAAVGVTYGIGDGFNTFNLPDLRGEFLRGWDDARGIDTGRTFGSAQGYATAPPQNTSPQRITQSGMSGLANASNPSKVGFARLSKSGENVTPVVDSVDAGTQMDVVNLVTGDSETRPRNRALLACIKF